MKAFTLLLLVVTISFSNARAASIDTAQIEKLSGLSGKYNEKENVFKVTKPRNDVKVTVDQWTMPPFMGLTSWVGFTPGKKGEFMIMGDLVLFQDEVNPVMSTLFEKHVDVTALHNHFFYEDPKVYFMHITGEGSLENLATAVHAVFDKISAIRRTNPQPLTHSEKSPLPEKSNLSVKPIEAIFNQTADTKDGMIKITVGRKVQMSCHCTAGKDMGVNTWAAFAGSDDNALVDGDFAVLESELQTVLRALRSTDINIVAIHSHMTGESPRTLFLHYWGRGKASELATSIHHAILKQK